MDSLILNSIAQLGAVGVLVGVLLWLVMRYEKRMEKIHLNHVREREAWMRQSAQQHEDIVAIAKESHTLLAEIKTILRNKR